MSLHVILWGLFVFTTAKDQDRSGICNVSWANNQMRLGCCLDFQLVDGNCKPCIGRHGPNCSLHCDFGFFGFGCRQLCNCSDRQGCDRHTGCFEELGVKSSSDNPT
ncbi:multiple epidermal growth factor-like domains protein 10 [Saccostrea cucullata]|uniref:multiple epidermal growth factor-like domains protein 10 n=1 Tax=Saccostrea cuccullata TaxID=36930 RepID=UPI002ED220A9